MQKLFKFFDEMKSQNDKFYSDVDIDEDKVIKIFFGQMQAAEQRM
jgi:hypothetical protein